LKDKYEHALVLYDSMTRGIYWNRPTCEKILATKQLWALSENELTINDDLKFAIMKKNNEKNLTIYSILKSKLKITSPSNTLGSIKRKSEALHDDFKNRLRITQSEDKNLKSDSLDKESFTHPFIKSELDYKASHRVKKISEKVSSVIASKVNLT
jgi:hypothetical protein